MPELDAYEVTACLNQESLPVKVVARQKDGAPKASVRNPSYEETADAEPAVTDMRITRLSDDPHNLGVASKVIEERQVLKSGNSNLKIIYVCDIQDGQKLNLEQDLIDPKK